MPDIFIASDQNKRKKFSFPVHLFSTVIRDPYDIRFNTQHKNEKIILILRRHWVTNLSWIMVSLLLLVLPIFFLMVNILEFFPLNISPILFLTAISFWYLATFGFVLINFLFWFYNVGIITNERVVDIDFIHLLYSEITETTIGKIEDVTSKRGGFLGIFWDYGNVFIQTAGTEANIEFEGIPKPTLVVRTISQLMEQRK